MEKWISFQHYSPNEILSVYEPTQIIHFKPRGIYFARDNAWWDWTMESGCSPNIYTHKYAIDLLKTPPLNILSITTENFKHIYEQYEVNAPKCLTGSLDWGSISKSYDGVYISDSLVQSLNIQLLLWTTYNVETLVVWTDKLTLRMTGEVNYPDYQNIE